METFAIDNLKVTATGGFPGRICWLLYPFEFLGDWIGEGAQKYRVSIAVVTGIDWDNDLTPWPAPGEPPGSPDFRGGAQTFLNLLTAGIVPAVEKYLGISADAERTLAGVSLSGLFTLWQWMLNDSFNNIISLSGSFWYDGFARWITSRPAPLKKGRAYFLLGDKEAKTKVKAFQPVQTNTVAIVDYLRKSGIDAAIELVPGNHYQFALQRLDRAFTWMFR